MSKKMPLVSVVILNFNGKDFLENCLRSVLATNYSEFEVILVDNGSTDGSVGLAEKIFGADPRIRIIRNRENIGFAAGNNVGAKASRGKYIVFLNVDVEIDRNWLSGLVKVMEEDQHIGAAQSKILSTRDRKTIDSAGGSLDYYGFGSPRGRGLKDEGQYGAGDVFFALGAVMITRREALDKAGLFDPDFFLNCEEFDLCWRIWLSGYRVVYVPASVAYHAVGGIIKQRAPTFEWTVRFHSVKNTITMLLKNYEVSNVVKYLPVSIFISGCISVVPILRGDLGGMFNRSAAFFRAIIWNLSNFKNVWIKRLRVQYTIRRVPDYEIASKVMVKKPVAAFPVR